MGNIETIDPDLNKPIDEVQKPSDGSVTQNPQTTTLATINTSDTISQFMEKVNNNFTTIINMGGGPKGVVGDKGDPGAPTKPKVFVHAWHFGYEFGREIEIIENKEYELENIVEDLTNCKYQEGHIIMLPNAHVYRLELNEKYELEPKFLIALQSYDPSSIIDGRNAYMHIAYTNDIENFTDFVTDQELRSTNSGSTTFSLTRNSNGNVTTNNEMTYMGIYSDYEEYSKHIPHMYTWVRVKGVQGERGVQGEKGEKGDGYTGQSYTIDVEGDMSTITLGIDRTSKNGYYECKLHAYYGNKNINLNSKHVTIGLPKEYENIGEFTIKQSNNDVIIGFTPNSEFEFPKNTIICTIHVETSVYDESDRNTYKFVRDTVWMIKGIVSNFSLEIIPEYRSIKLNKDGYTPEKLKVNIYKLENGERTLFNITDTDFTLLYKNYNDSDTTGWKIYTNDGVSTNNVSCLEFKLVRYYNSVDTKFPEEIWDYEDVWVVADGKDTHYYHADLGATESMLVLTTGEKKPIGENYCAVMRSKTGYSITFDPKFFDGSEECIVTGVNIGSNSGDEYVTNGVFERELYISKNSDDTINSATLTIRKVPYGVEMIPMNIVVNAKCPDEYDENGVVTNMVEKSDTVSFNIYISTLSDIYSLNPTVSSYNTSTGKTGDGIECFVFKNIEYITTDKLSENDLILKYIVHQKDNKNSGYITYNKSLKFEEDFVASDIAIDFILYYNPTVSTGNYNQLKDKEIVRSTVPLIKDGINGEDGNSWQYIFCRSSIYPFGDTGISNPSEWEDNDEKNPNNELLGNGGDKDENWYDNHKGVDSKYKYEYQSYRKWDKVNKKWGKFGYPTLYSNFSDSGSGYSVLLSNPIAVIPVGNDNWMTNENLKSQYDSTLVYLYNNTSDISNNDNVTISFPELDNPYVNNGNFTIGKNDNGINKIIFNPVVGDSVFSFDQNNQYKLPITLTYDLGKDIDGNEHIFTTTVYWTLSPMKGNEDVEVFVDKYVVNTSASEEYSLAVGYDLTSNNTKTSVRNRENNPKNYKIILTDNIDNTFKSNSIEVNNWENVSYKFVDADGNNINCYVVLVDSDKTTIIDYAIVTAVNNGNSAIHLELTQDYISLPSDNYGYVHPDYKETIGSQMQLYNGDNLITNDITYSFKINGVDVEKDKITIDSGKFTIPSDIICGDTKIECTAIYKNVPYTKTLTLDLENVPYELEVYNTDVITRNVNTGKIINETLKVRVKYWLNGAWVYTHDGVLIATTSKVDKKAKLIFSREDNDNENYWRIFYLSESQIVNDIESTEVKISYYATDDTELENELSYENIGIINSGKNGETGKNAIHLELSQDYISLPSQPDGKGVHEDYTDQILSQMILYNGDETITDLKLVSYSFEIDGVDKNKINEYVNATDEVDGGIVITKEKINGNTKIKCIATYNNVKYIKTLTIELVETPYELEINKNILTRNKNEGKITDDKLTVCVKYWMNGKWNYTPKGSVVLHAIEENPFVFNIDENSPTYMRTFTITGTTFEVNKKATEVKISYYATDDTELKNELSYENIGIVDSGKDGKPGVAPSCVNVKIIGYSLSDDIDANNDAGWEKSLNALGTLSTGQQIYLRNEYTWSDETITYGKTTTMAGTQGPSGKSRVLFYLGSFEDGTLTGDLVEGFLTDDRCDYYIDSKGNAWMRRGDSESANGLFVDQTENADWVKAETVGFLKAGAISANMINTGSITANSAFVTKLFSQEITANTLEVTDANFSGLLSAEKIDVDNITVNKLNTNPNLNKSYVNILDNEISIISVLENDDNTATDDYVICQFSDNSINKNIDNAFSGGQQYDPKTYENKDFGYNNTTIGAGLSGDISVYYLSKETSQQFLSENSIYIYEDISNNFDDILYGGSVVTFNIDITSDFKGIENLIKNNSDIVQFKVEPLIKIYETIGNKDIPIYNLNKTGQNLSSASALGSSSSPGYELTDTITLSNSAKYKYIIPKDGVYKFKAGATAYIELINYKGSSTVKYELTNIRVRTNITGNNDHCMTKICKDGILIKNNVNGLLVCDEGIVLKFNKYAIKFNDEGIFYTKDLENYSGNLNNNNIDWKVLIGDIINPT